MIEQTQATGGGPWPFPRIRYARPDEVPVLMEMCRRLHAENGLARMKEHLVRAEIENAIDRKYALIAVIGDGDRIEGSICLKLAHYWYDDSSFWLEDRWMFVLPEYRDTSNAKEMLRFAKWVAQDMLQIPLMMGILSNDRTEAKRRLYERELGPATGAFFLVGATTGQKEAPHV